MNSVWLLSSYAAVRVRQCLYLLLFFSTVSTGLAQGTAAKVVFLAEPSGSTTANQPFATQPVVEIQDSGGSRVVTSATVAVSIAMNGGIFMPGTLFGTTTLATVNGRATFSGLSIDKIGTYTLKVTSVGLATSTTSTFTITTGVPYRLVFHTEPENGIAGIPLNPQLVVRVQDEGGNHVSNNANTAVLLSVASGPEGIASIEQNPAYTFAGFATFSGLVLHAAGCYTLQASTSGLVSATSAVLCITSDAASITTSTVSAVVNTLPVGGSTSAVIVQLKDVFGNDVDDNADCVRLFATSGPGAVTQIPAYIGSGRWAGIYTSSGMPGQVVISAFLKPDGQSGCAFPGVGYAAIHDTAQLNVVAGVASATTSTITTASVTVGAGQTVELTVNLYDALGNPTTSGLVSLEIAQGGGSLSATMVTSTTRATITYTAGIDASVDAIITAKISSMNIVSAPVVMDIVIGTLTIASFEDRDWDDIQDMDEPLLPDQVFTLVYPTQTTATITTGTTGTIAIPVIAGIYTICKVTSACWYPTTSACKVTNVENSTTTNVVFGNSSTRLLHIIAFDDVNGNAVLDEDELSIAGQEFMVTYPSGTTLTITTDTTGGAYISTTCGTYTVCELTPTDCEAIIETCQTVALVGGEIEAVERVIMRVIPLADKRTLKIQLWQDGNGNKWPNRNEPGVRGYLKIWNPETENEPLDWIPTDITGGYRTKLKLGSLYRVKIYVPPGWENTTEAERNIELNIVPGLNTYRFGIRPIPPPPTMQNFDEHDLYSDKAVKGIGVDVQQFKADEERLFMSSHNLEQGGMRSAIGADDILRSVTAVREQEQSGNPHLRSIPNPTSGETTISYVLSQPATVRLDVYTMIGKYIGTVEEGQHPEGEYHIPVSLWELPSGFYHVRLTVHNQVYTLMVINNK